MVNIVDNVYILPGAERRGERILKDEDFCVPETEEVFEDGNKDDVVEPVEDLFVCQMAWMPPTLKKCPLSKDCMRERSFHREASMFAGRADGEIARPRALPSRHEMPYSRMKLL